MTEYVAIPDSDLEAGDGIKSEHALAFNNNVLAINEMDQTAINAGLYSPGGWYAVDASGQIGPLWDASSDGAVSEIVTPDFEDGFEYRIVGIEVSRSGGGGAGSAAVVLELYMQSDAVYVSSGTLSLLSSDANVSKSFEAVVPWPMQVAFSHYVSVPYFPQTAVATHANIGNVISSFAQPEYREIHRVTPQKISKARISVNSGTMTGGKIYLLKRKGGI